MNKDFLPSYIREYLQNKFPNNDYTVEYFQTCLDIVGENNSLYYVQIHGGDYQIEMLDNLNTDQTSLIGIGYKAEATCPFVLIRTSTISSAYFLTGYKIIFKNQIWQ